MKKILFTILFALCTAIAFCQGSFKLGLVNSIDIDDKLKHGSAILGSAMAELDYSYTGTVAFTLNVGYLRNDNSGEGFSQFPVLAGIKYRFDETFYTGISGGVSWFDEKIRGTQFTFSPMVGANIKRLSVDIRYLHTTIHNPLMTTAIVISYNF